jgi:hypothetical protein
MFKTYATAESLLINEPNYKFIECHFEKKNNQSTSLQLWFLKKELRNYYEMFLMTTQEILQLYNKVIASMWVDFNFNRIDTSESLYKVFFDRLYRSAIEMKLEQQIVTLQQEKLRKELEELLLK